VGSFVAVAIPITRTQASNGGAVASAARGGFADVVSAIPMADGKAALTGEEPRPVTFTVHQGGYVSTHVSSQGNIGPALVGVGINVDELDMVSPAPGSALGAGMHVYIRHPIQTQLFVAGVEQQVRTHAATVGAMLSEMGVQLGSLDRVTPKLETPIRQGLRIRVTTMRDVTEVLEEPIPFDTLYVYDADVEDGRRLLDTAGSSGSVRREYAVRLINGRIVRRDLVSETSTAPTNEVVIVGTYVRPAPTPTPARVTAPIGDLACSRTLNVYATWYTAASSGGSGITATGTGVYKGIVAVDPTVIPLGTQMYIPGYGYGLAADTGSGIKGNMIDLGYGADDVKDWRTHWQDICIL